MGDPFRSVREIRPSAGAVDGPLPRLQTEFGGELCYLGHIFDKDRANRIPQNTFKIFVITLLG